MIQTNARLFSTLLLVFVDISALSASFFVAFLIRFHSRLEDIEALSTADATNYIELGLAITLLGPLLFAASGMYKSTNLLFGLTEYVLALRSVALLVLVIIFVSFLVGAEPIVSRTWIAIWVLICVLFLVSGRFGARRLITQLRRRGTMQESVLIVGADAQGAAIAQQLSNTPGVKVLGFLDEFLPVGTKISDRFTILGSSRQIDSVARETGTDIVLMIPAAVSWESRQLLMLDSLQPHETRRWVLHIAPGVYEMASLGAELGRVGNVPVLRLHGSSIVGLDALLKRSIDISIAVGLLAVLGIPSLIVATYLKLRDRTGINRTPVLGLNGKAFELISFNLGVAPGRFPEGFERLPMLLHVLKGDMSIIGPRPRNPNDSSHSDRPELLAVRPGVVSVVPRSVVLSSNDEWTRIEATYTRNYSIWSDITLLLRAFLMGLRFISPIARTPKRTSTSTDETHLDPDNRR